MINLERSGIPRDDQIPDLDAVTLRLLSDQIAAAGDASTGASAAVTGIHQRRPWLRRSALIAAAAAAAVAVTSAVLPSPSAEAWSATPTLAGADAWATAQAGCQQMMDSSAAAVIVERRGDSSFTVLGDTSMCLQVLYDGSLRPASGGQQYLPADVPGAGEVQVIHSNVLWAMADVTSDERGNRVETITRGYVDTIGRVGSGVESIVIHTVDNGDVTASIDNGWFAAWWPSLEKLPTSMTVTTSTGTYDVAL